MKIKDQRKLMAIQAYQISRWVWDKNVNINKILKEIDNNNTSKKMSDEQMLNQVKALNSMFGGAVIKNGRKK